MDSRYPTEEFLRKIDIHELLPQQEPFVMIDTLTHFDMTRTVTELTVPAGIKSLGAGTFNYCTQLER